MEGGSGPRGGVHNKQMFILSGFIISDPDCTYGQAVYLRRFGGPRPYIDSILAPGSPNASGIGDGGPKTLV